MEAYDIQELTASKSLAEQSDKKEENINLVYKIAQCLLPCT